MDEEKNKKAVKSPTTIPSLAGGKQNSNAHIKVCGIDIEWRPEAGLCTVEQSPATMMWIDSTLKGLMAGVQSMVGTERFLLALQSEGRNSVETDWKVISNYPDFREGFEAIARVATVAGWGNWSIVRLDMDRKEAIFRVRNSWEGSYQKSLGVCWGSAMLAGKMAGCCSRLFGTNCWADQTSFIARGDEYDEFDVKPSNRSIEREIEELLATDEATKADMAVALEKLNKEIKERMQVEFALRESEDRFRSLVETTSDWIWEIDRDFKYTYSNPRVKEILGFDPEEIIGKTAFDMLSVGESDSFRESLDKIGTSKKAFTRIESVKKTKEGKRIVFETSVVPIFNEDGDLYAYRGIERDISVRKRAEKLLFSQYELAKALSESSDMQEVLNHLLYSAFQLDGVDSGGIYLVNQATGELTLAHYRGLSETFIKENSKYPEDSPNTRIVMEGNPVFNTYDRLKQEMNGVDREENIKAIAVLPIKYENRVIAAINLASHTVDEFPVSTKNAILPLAAQVGGAIVRITNEEERRELEARMLHAQKLESLGILAGGIAHDFNNLLQAILGNADLLLRGESRESHVTEFAKEIMKASKHAADLCNQMLAYSGKGRFIVEPTDISSMLSEIAHLLKVSISKKVSMIYSLEENLPHVMADATQLQQIFMNLITNASEAIGDRQGEISIKTYSLECDLTYLKDNFPHDRLSEGRYIVVEIADNGCGMHSETISQIFDPFFTTKFAGRGLGLSAVLGIVRSHGGAISVESELDHGTTFRVIFPACDESPGAESLNRGREEVRDDTRFSGTVLLIDDEATVRKVVTKMLEHLGFSVLTACDGEAGLELFNDQSEEIVCTILDLTMPNVDGEECFKSIRRMNKDARIILSSGYDEASVTRRFTDMEHVGFIQKPYVFKALKKKLKETLKPN